MSKCEQKVEIHDLKIISLDIKLTKSGQVIANMACQFDRLKSDHGDKSTGRSVRNFVIRLS